MREMLEDMFGNGPIDPIEAARRNMRPNLRKLCYRASTPEGLVARQSQHWDPVLAWAREAHGARFVLSEGVMFVAQPGAAIAAACTAIPTDPWRLGAVSLITTLTGSALIALAVAANELSVDEAWAA